MKIRRAALLSSLIILFAAVVLTIVTVTVAGESPLQVARILRESAFGDGEAFSYTLLYATPLLLTGAAVVIPFRAGLFNIGAEGQLYAGAVAAIGAGLYAGDHGWPAPVAWAFGFGASFLAGALYAAVAGFLRVYRGVHEVMSTIMMNFIALALSNMFILGVFKNPETQSLETRWIAEGFRIEPLWQFAPKSFPVALILSLAALLAIAYSWWGYRVRACGFNQSAAKTAGIRVNRTLMSAMALGGGLAGLVGFHEVFFASHRLIDGFSPQYGFTGIAIAILCRGQPIGFVLSAFLFAALHKGAFDLDLETDKITRDLSYIIQALLLICLAAGPALERWIEQHD